MIRSFKCSETEKVYKRIISRRLPQDIQRVALRKLWLLDAAVDLKELRIPPNNRLETLSGDRKGQHSIRINRQWRICFRWRSGDAFEVEIVDYH
jgi:toxin HigB-1